MRDGEQAPGIFFSLAQKVMLAGELEEAGLDIIEVGFPASSEAERSAVEAVSRMLKTAECAALARLTPEDIEIAAQALKDARRSRMILFAPTSQIALAVMHGTVANIQEAIVTSVRRAVSRVSNVQITLVDAWRANSEFLIRLASAAVDAGANAVVLADTVGCAVPDEVAGLVKSIRRSVPMSVDVGVHCHNDLGLATANSLAAIAAGATMCEVTIAGVGERAGNAALEEITSVLETKPEIYEARTGFDRRFSYSLYEHLREITGHKAQPNKAIIGDNAFTHSSGIHQRGVLENPRTFEWLSAADVGREGARIALGKLSGSAAIKAVVHRRHPSLQEIPTAVLEEIKKYLSIHGTISMETLDLYVNNGEAEGKA